MMVEEQGQVFDQVEEHAANIEHDVEKGNDHISRAVVIARSTRAVSILLSVFILNFLVFKPFIKKNRKNGVVSSLPLALLS